MPTASFSLAKSQAAEALEALRVAHRLRKRLQAPLLQVVVASRRQPAAGPLAHHPRPGHGGLAARQQAAEHLTGLPRALRLPGAEEPGAEGDLLAALAAVVRRQVHLFLGAGCKKRLERPAPGRPWLWQGTRMLDKKIQKVKWSL